MESEDSGSVALRGGRQHECLTHGGTEPRAAAGLVVFAFNNRIASS